MSTTTATRSTLRSRAGGSSSSAPPSIGGNLRFQMALRDFVDAQKELFNTSPDEAGSRYAEQEKNADAATLALVRTVDEFIKRRRRTEARQEEVRAHNIREEEVHARACRLMASNPHFYFAAARRAEVSTVIQKRGLELLQRRQGARVHYLMESGHAAETDPEAETWIWALAYMLFLKRRRTELHAQANLEMDAVLEDAPQTPGGRALRRCHHLLVKLILRRVKEKIRLSALCTCGR